MAGFKLTRRGERDDDVTSEVPLELAASSFLGVLVADEVDPSKLTGGYRDLYGRFEALRQRYLDGLIEVDAYGRALGDLKFVDRFGGEWVIGATSGRWYHRPRQDQPWVPTPPDPELA